MAFLRSEPSRTPENLVTGAVPVETWYWAALASIGISALFKLMGKDNMALFIGQWPPTFLLFGLYQKTGGLKRG